jgi:Uncharacterised nucleotidyltransferase
MSCFTSPTAPVTVTRPEIELLLCCARTNVTPATAERIGTIQKDCDWDYVLQVAARHRVLPLLFHNLNAICPKAVPQPVLTQLHHHFQANALRNMALTQELLKVVDLFQERDIPVIPFKGPVLAISTYGNLALHQAGDLDLLVHEPYYPKAKTLLLAQGYQMLYDGEHEAAHLQGQLWNEERKISVDLHYGIPPKELQLNPESFWEGSQVLMLAGKKMEAFSPEAHLLLLCVNGHKESWSRLAKLCSLAALIHTHPQIDWERLSAWAEQLKIKRIFYLGLLLANHLLGAILPEKIIQRAKAHPVRRFLVEHWHERLLCEPAHLPDDLQNQPFSSGPIARHHQHLYHLAGTELLPDRVRYSLRYIRKRKSISIPMMLGTFSLF